MIDEKKRNPKGLSVISSTLGLTEGSHITEAEDGSGTLRHAGSDINLHMQVIMTRLMSVIEKEVSARHGVSEIERTKRQRGIIAVILFVVSSLILAFAPHDRESYIAAVPLLIVAGAMGYSSIKIKMPGIELSGDVEAGQPPPQ